MRKLKAFAFYAIVILTFGVLGLAFWLDTRQPPQPSPHAQPQQPDQSPAEPEMESLDLPGTGDSSEPFVLRKCLASDGQYTHMLSNDPNCEIVDGKGTVSFTGRIPRHPELEKRRQSKKAAVQRQTQQNQGYEPNIRLTGKNPPRGTSRECKFPIGRALEIERPLSAANNPSESVWRDEYCEWAFEAYELRCPDLKKTLHYDELCWFLR